MRFAPAAFERLIERLYTAGAHGLYVNGYTGEGLLQDVEQRKRVAETAVRCAPAGKAVIVHVGAHRTLDALELARHAATIGAAAISSLPPLGPYSSAEIRGYYQAICDASDLPVLVYYFPEMCPAIREPGLVQELLGLPNVVGLKFTDFDLYTLSLLKNSGGVVFNGRDEVLAAGLLMGADGGIGTFYNLTPGLFVKVFDSARAGQWEEARQTQSRINELVEIILQFPLIPATKLILAWQGIDCGPAMEPRRRLTDEEQKRLRELIRSSSFAGLAS